MEARALYLGTMQLTLVFQQNSSVARASAGISDHQQDTRTTGSILCFGGTLHLPMRAAGPLDHPPMALQHHPTWSALASPVACLRVAQIPWP
jgi:hypothetical protein